MSVVKGSEQYKLEITPYNPVKRWLGRLLLVVFMAGAVAGSYYGGHFKGMQEQAAAVAERDELKVRVVSAEQKAERLRQDVANLKLGAEVDKQSQESVRGEVIGLQEQIKELEGQISFYKGLWQPSGSKSGLTFGSFNLVGTGAPGRYSYKLVVQQLATNHKLLSGHLNFTVVGTQNGLPVRLPLKDLTKNISYENIKLRFKYFQNFQGEMLLPDGFVPTGVELLAKVKKPKAATVEQKFGWLVQES